MEVRLNRFKQFESKNVRLSNDDLKELFYDLLDNDYEITFYDSANDIFNKYYFDLKKKYDGSEFGYIMKDNVWGCSDLKSINNEITKVINILEDAKNRIYDLGYIIYFEPEFTFGDECYFNIICHAQHEDFIRDYED